MVQTTLQSETEYDQAVDRIEELMERDSLSDSEQLELDYLCDKVHEYDLIHYPVEKPDSTLGKIIEWILIKLRIF